MKRNLNSFMLLVFFCCIHLLRAQTCYNIGPRNNGNGLGNTCGTPNCSANTKQGHFDVSFGASCPVPIPTMELISVTVPPMPTPFCFDPGRCISPGTVRYCFRGTNLPSSGFMTIRFTLNSTIWNCSYSVTGGGGALLPVQLSYFEAKLQNGHVKISWRTEQEFHNNKFVIERSNNGSVFDNIGTVNGRGNSSIPVDYDYLDVNPLKGISYYRLRQIDIDGQSAYSIIKKIDNRIEGLQISRLFPNPAGDHVILQLILDKANELYVKIFNSSGQLVISASKKEAAGTKNWQILLPNLSKGVYELILTTKSGGILTEKMLIQ